MRLFPRDSAAWSAVSYVKPVLSGRNQSPNTTGNQTLSPAQSPTDTFVKQRQPQFQGKHLTQILNEGYLLNASQFRTILALDDDAYYGSVPEALANAAGCSDATLKTALETVVAVLQAKEPKELTCQLGPEKSLQVDFAGEGTDARVYRLTAGDASYALKVFFTPGSGSAMQETANGAFFNAHATRDVSRLYLSNLAKRWTLMEFVDKGTRLAHRSGLTMKQQHFGTDDELHSPNKINGILVDHGGVMDIPDTLRMKPEQFKKRLIDLGLPSPDPHTEGSEPEKAGLELTASKL